MQAIFIICSWRSAVSGYYVVYRFNGIPLTPVLPAGKTGEKRCFLSLLKPPFHNTARPQIPFSCENIHNHTVVDILVRAATPLCLSNTVFTVRSRPRRTPVPLRRHYGGRKDRLRRIGANATAKSRLRTPFAPKYCILEFFGGKPSGWRLLCSIFPNSLNLNFQASLP